MEIGISPEGMLIERILRGEHQLFHDLVRPYERKVYLCAFSVLHNEGDAEDASQDALLKAFTHLHQFRGEAKFSTWLISIVINEARHRLRASRNRKTESLDADPEHQSFPPSILADWSEVPLRCLEAMETRKALREAVAELPEIYRVVFIARDVEGLSVSDTAEALGITIASVKVRLHRARMMLQRKLAPYLKTNVGPRRRTSWF